MNQYEIGCILKGDVESEEADLCFETIKNLFKKYKMEVQKEDIWGRRELAYKIKGQNFGYYVFYQLEANPQVIVELERDLKLNKELLRYFITKLVPIREKVEKKAKKATPAGKVKKEEIVAEVAERVSPEETEVTKPKKVKRLEKEKPRKISRLKVEKGVKEGAARVEKKPKKVSREKVKKTGAEEVVAEEKAEKERMAKLDEKLKEILGE